MGGRFSRYTRGLDSLHTWFHCLIRSAYHLREEDITAWKAWKPLVSGAPHPPRPSWVGIVVSTGFGCAVFAVVFYGTLLMPTSHSFTLTARDASPPRKPASPTIPLSPTPPSPSLNKARTKETRPIDKAPSFSPLQEKIDHVSISFGSNGVQQTFPIEQLQQGPVEFRFQKILNVAGKSDADYPEPIRIKMKDNALLLSTALPGGPYMPDPIRIIDNQFSNNSPPGWDINRTDIALEVINEKHEAVFQAIRKSSNRIVINGVFYSRVAMWLANDAGIKVVPPGKPYDDFKLNPLFRYPAWRFPGKYADDK